MQSQKRQNDLSSFLRQTIQYHSNPSLCLNHWCWRSWSWTVLWRPTRSSRNNTSKRWPFHYRGLECKTRKSRDTWSNRQIWPWNTKWSRAKANTVLPREHTDHNKLPLPTQEKTLHMDITRWSIPKSDWLYSLQQMMERLYTVSKNKTGSWLWLRSWTPYFQNQTLIEESKENHRTFQVWPKSNLLWLCSRSDKQTQGIRFDRQSAWRTLDGSLWHCTGGSDRDHPQEKEAKWFSEEALQIAEKRRESKGKAEKERYTHLNAEFQRITQRDKKAFLSYQCKEIEENNRRERLEISSRKLEIPREHFMQRWAQ